MSNEARRQLWSNEGSVYAPQDPLALLDSTDAYSREVTAGKHEYVRRPEWDEVYKFPVYVSRKLSDRIQAAIDRSGYKSWDGYLSDFWGTIQQCGWEYCCGWVLGMTIVDSTMGGEEKDWEIVECVSGIVMYFPGEDQEVIVFAEASEVLSRNVPAS